MSARAGEWHLLGHGRDPVPGEPSHASRLADGYAETAADIERLAGRLRRLSDLDGWKGEAAEKFGESAQDLAEDLARAERRYRDLAAAVREWVQPLSTARDESFAALREAEQADDDARRFGHDPFAGIAEPTPDQVLAQQRRQDARDAALASKRAAQRRLDDALRDLDAAAHRVGEKIRGAAEHGSDGMWDNVKGSVRSVAGKLEAIVDVLSYVAMALAAIIIVCALVASAPFALIALAFVVSVAVLGLNLALVLSDSGKATWSDVALDIVGLATAGVGTGLAPGVRAVLPMLRGQVVGHVGHTARAAEMSLQRGFANYARAGNATRIAQPDNPLRRWGQQYLDDAARRASEVGARAAAEVEATALAAPPRWLTAMMLDREMAQALRQAQQLRQVAVAHRLPVVDHLDEVIRHSAVVGAVNVVGTAGTVAGGADQVSGDFGGPESLQWKDRWDQSVPTSEWRLTRE